MLWQRRCQDPNGRIHTDAQRCQFNPIITDETDLSRIVIAGKIHNHVRITRDTGIVAEQSPQVGISDTEKYTIWFGLCHLIVHYLQ